MPQPLEGLEHDSAQDALPGAKGAPRGAMNKGEPRAALDKRMTPRAPAKKATRYPWGDEWLHIDNPAVWVGEV